jgi:DMSO reductase family type II enzyme chaperone
MYFLLSLGLSFPDDRFHGSLLADPRQERLAEAAAGLPHLLRLSALDWTVPAACEDFQSDYIRLFDVGPSGQPPCPLHSGHYVRDRLRHMEILVRFYNFFGLRTAPGLLPDHATVQLEFMHYLTGTEHEAETPGKLHSIKRAEHDFLRSHLRNWWPSLAGRLQQQNPPPFYRSLVALTDRFLAADAEYLRGETH